LVERSGVVAVTIPDDVVQRLLELVYGRRFRQFGDAV
jgi:hypothetical protein